MDTRLPVQKLFSSCNDRIVPTIANSQHRPEILPEVVFLDGVGHVHLVITAGNWLVSTSTVFEMAQAIQAHLCRGQSRREYRLPSNWRISRRKTGSAVREVALERSGARLRAGRVHLEINRDGALGWSVGETDDLGECVADVERAVTSWLLNSSSRVKAHCGRIKLTRVSISDGKDGVARDADSRKL